MTVHNTDPAKGDTDGDGFSDFDEVDSSSDPNLSSSYPGSEPPVVYHDVLPMQNIGGAWGQTQGLDIFSSLGQPYSLGMSSDFSNLNLTGFSFMGNPPGSQIFQLDTDGDSISNLEESALGTDDSTIDSNLDQDGDGLNTLAEFNAGTNPFEVDTDLDGLSDFQEVQTFGTNPLLVDSDADGYQDLEKFHPEVIRFLLHPIQVRINHFIDHPFSPLIQEGHLPLPMEIIIYPPSGRLLSPAESKIIRMFFLVVFSHFFKIHPLFSSSKIRHPPSWT